MRIALISFTSRTDDAAGKILKKLQTVCASDDNQVDILNGNEELTNTRLTAYDYIAVVAKSAGFFSSKVSPKIAQYLSMSGNVSGKKACALVIKSGLFSEKACRNLMRIMESEGVKIDYFDVIRDVDHAAWVGKKIG